MIMRKNYIREKSCIHFFYHRLFKKKMKYYTTFSPPNGFLPKVDTLNGKYLTEQYESVDDFFKYHSEVFKIGKDGMVYCGFSMYEQYQEYFTNVLPQKIKSSNQMLLMDKQRSRTEPEAPLMSEILKFLENNISPEGGSNSEESVCSSDSYDCERGHITNTKETLERGVLKTNQSSNNNSTVPCCIKYFGIENQVIKADKLPVVKTNTSQVDQNGVIHSANETHMEQYSDSSFRHKSLCQDVIVNWEKQCIRILCTLLRYHNNVINIRDSALKNFFSTALPRNREYLMDSYTSPEDFLQFHSEIFTFTLNGDVSCVDQGDILKYIDGPLYEKLKKKRLQGFSPSFLIANDQRSCGYYGKSSEGSRIDIRDAEKLAQITEFVQVPRKKETSTQTVSTGPILSMMHVLDNE